MLCDFSKLKKYHRLILTQLTNFTQQATPTLKHSYFRRKILQNPSLTNRTKKIEQYFHKIVSKKKKRKKMNARTQI